ncbi:MAG: OmpH family outer membrane protein [Chitinophagales bacterium]|nr:OmpH family outer membrane protein [Bacteroidota bacterium]
MQKLYFAALIIFFSSLLMIQSCTSPTTDTNNTSDNNATTDTLHEAGINPPSGVKYGYINSLELLNYMPEVTEANKSLESYARKKESEFNALMKEYENKVRNLQENAQNLSPVQQQDKVKEISGIEERLQKMQMSGQEDVAREKDRLYAPIVEKANKAIKEIGAENNYTFIFDAAALLYADTTLNLMPQLKEKLGIADSVGVVVP